MNSTAQKTGGISAPFIRRPVATTLFTISILLAGIVAYRKLPVAPLPQMDIPTIFVNGGLPGASPETMASAVATPLERQFGRIASITQMTSRSQLGSTSVVMQFDLNRDVNAAARDVLAAASAAHNELPTGMPSAPTYRKVNPADYPILQLAMTSKTVPLTKVYDYADSIVDQKLSQVEGVGQVNVQGSAQPAVRVEIDPQRLNAYGISLEQVRGVLATANSNRPKGELQSANRSWVINDTDQLLQADQYRPLIVAWRNGNAVRLGDIADVVDGVADLRTAGTANGEPAVSISIVRQPGANILATVDRIRKLLPVIEASIPPSIHVRVINDRSPTIRASIHDIEIAMLISVLLVVIVVFAFLRDPWATAIPSIAVPLSLVGTFAVMFLLGYSIDNLSLMALTIATGFVVDDAIVMIENIARHIEAGMRPLTASLLGSREMGFTVLSMSLSLVAVFTPILLMGGVLGRLFREFAVVLSTAIFFSLVVSLTTTPMMCSKFLRHERGKHGWLYRLMEAGFNGMHRGYRVGLDWVLQHQGFTLTVFVATVILNIHLFMVVPKGFFPQQDTGRLSGNIVADQDISFTAMHQKMDQLAAIVQADPAVDTVTASTGGGNAANTANVNVQLKPLNERKLSADQVIARLRRATGRVAGATLFFQSVQDVSIGGRQANAQFQYTLTSDSITDLNHWAPILSARMAALPELRDVNTDQQVRGLEESVVIDRTVAGRLGVPMQAIDDTLNDAFGQEQVSTMYEGINQYHVVEVVTPNYQRSPTALSDIYVADSAGKLVPLSAMAHFEPDRMALQVNHQGQGPAITISFNLAPGASLGDAERDVEIAKEQIGLPPTVSGSFQGTAAAFQTSLQSEPWLVAFALAAVYIVLGMLYESYIHPVTILSTLPPAGVGAILALMLFHQDLNIIAFIGIVLLIGIVKKNAIMMIDFALIAEREGKMTARAAIREASLLRFRPIMMTTMAAMLGALPLAFGRGNGAELRQPLGITIVGGLIVSQMLTLYTTPVIYLYMDRLQNLLRSLKPHHTPALAPSGD